MKAVYDKKSHREVLNGLAFLFVLLLATGCRPPEDVKDAKSLTSPQFSIRGWESQLENFWCKWMGGAPEWFRNERYLAYLRDAFSRAPEYNINTFMLMGRGDQGELHTFVDYPGWDHLFKRQSDEKRKRAKEQAEVLEALAVEARQSGVDLYLWDHELQLPDDFADLYPEAKGVGTPICPSSPIVWHLLADKYEEFFKKVPSLAGIVLVFAETQFNMLEGSSCGCDKCHGKTGADFVQEIILTANKACERHNKQLVVRNFGHNWDQLNTVLDAIRSVDTTESFITMSKMVPCDFFGLQLPPDPSTTSLPGRPRILEDVVGGEFRGKTHNIVVPDEYYAQHLQHAAAYGGNGAVFRLDHSAYPRSVFETPNEFNVWLTSRLMVDPHLPLDSLWHKWTSEKYGEKAAPFVIEALSLTDDIWEHSTNSLGFYSTSAHGHIAPFFRGPYNAYDALRDVGHIRARSSRKMERKFQELLNPDREILEEVVNERKLAVQWAGQSLSALQKAKPHLTENAYADLSHYLELQLEASRLWCDLGDLFFTGLIILKADKFPNDLVERLRNTTDHALRQRDLIVKKFGRGWPIIPDADGRGTSVEFAISGLWGELLDVTLGITPEPYPWNKIPVKPHDWGKKRIPRSDAELLYLTILEAGAGLDTETISIERTSKFEKIYFKGTSMIVVSSNGTILEMPVSFPIKGVVLEGDIPYSLQVNKDDAGLTVEVMENPG